MRLFVLPLLAILLAVSGCEADPKVKRPQSGGKGCVSTRSFFGSDVWDAFMANDCAGCHNPQGVARNSDLVLQGNSTPGNIDYNLAVVSKLALVRVQGEPLLLRKARGELDHGGGARLKTSSDAYAALTSLVDRVENPVACTDTLGGTALAARITLLDPKASLRRLTLTLAQRLPTSDELQAVADGGDDALAPIVDGLLQEDGFYQRMETFWDDKLLTGRYMGGSQAVNLLDSKDFPQRAWMNDDKLEPDEATRKLGQGVVNTALAHESLHLISHVLREQRPFSEVLTANYVFQDPLTARSYGVLTGFSNPLDPTEQREIQVPGVPHSGVLTTPAFLNRFPTTATNRNRHRARTVFDLFMATDVLKLGDRPIDPTQVTDHTPTLFNADCTVCHTVMEPVAGTFQNWDDKGRYRPPKDGWFADMWPPGFGQAELPAADRPNALQWLAQQVVADDRFAMGAVHVLVEGLLGRKPLPAPNKDDPAFVAKKLAFDLEQAELAVAATAMRNAKLELRAAVKALVLSPLFRVGGVAADATDDERAAVLQLGGDRWLTPEELDVKIRVTVGNGWPRWDGKSWLLMDYRLLFGGIDGDDVTARVRSPNGVMLAVVKRMANEMACKFVTADFVRPKAQRRLMPLVERTYAPEDNNGFAITQAEMAIKHNIQYLHAHLLGETLQLSDDELERTWLLFRDTWREGQEALGKGSKNGGVDVWLNWSCAAREDPDTGAKLDDKNKIEQDPNYVLRSWMAVVSYLLQDARFLHQ
jgi:hypothetical protein